MSEIFIGEGCTSSLHCTCKLSGLNCSVIQIGPNGETWPLAPLWHCHWSGMSQISWKPLTVRAWRGAIAMLWSGN